MKFPQMYLLNLYTPHFAWLLLGGCAIVLALVRPLPLRVRMLLIFGGAALAASRVGGLAWLWTRPGWVEPPSTVIELAATTLSVILGMMQVAGVALLIAAALVDRAGPPFSPSSSDESEYSEPTRRSS